MTRYDAYKLDSPPRFDDAPDVPSGICCACGEPLPTAADVGLCDACCDRDDDGE